MTIYTFVNSLVLKKLKNKMLESSRDQNDL